MSRHRVPVEPHAEVDQFVTLIPQPRSATSLPGGTRRTLPERAESSDWPSLPCPRISQSGPMSAVAAVPASRFPTEPGPHPGPDASANRPPALVPDDVGYAALDTDAEADVFEDWLVSTTPGEGLEHDTSDWELPDGAPDETPIQDSHYTQTEEAPTATGWDPSADAHPIAGPLAAPVTAPIVVPIVLLANSVEPATEPRPLEQLPHDNVTDPTELLDPQPTTRPAPRRQQSPPVHTHRAPTARPGKPALVACAVLGLVAGATATIAVGKTFWASPDPTTSPGQVVAVPPLLTPPPPVTPAPQTVPTRPQGQAGETHQKATTDRAAGGGKPTVLAQGPVRDLRIWLTGYSFQDNTPPSSAIVSAPILHETAGGTGTYSDPITVAVPGHASDGDMAWKGGTRFYLPTVQRYVIVEDSGASPAPSGQDGHLDMWVDGQGGSKSASDNCMDKITGTGIPAIMNPPTGKPVIVGPITSNGTCHIPTGTSSSDEGVSSRN